MNRKNYSMWIFIIIFFPGILGMIRVVHAESVKVGGSGFALGIMKILAESFEEQYPGINIKIFPSLGSSGGIKAVLNGRLDIGLSARPLNKAEKNKDIIDREIARTPFVLFANPSVDKEGITFQELERIYCGQDLSWPDGTRIRLVLRPKQEQDISIIRKFSPSMNQAVDLSFSREGMNYAITDQENASAVEKTKGSIGFGSLTQILSENRKVKLLSLNGLTPSIKGLANGSYPWFKSFYLITTAQPSPGVHKFEKFICSDAGSILMNNYGNIKLTNKDLHE